jgi:predicted ATP-grasp superfamily ATP-dependent carboligase
MTKPSQNPPVYVLGGGINALAVVRNLGRHGVLVNWVVERKKEAFHSRYCREIIEVPQIEKDIHALIGFLDDPVRRRPIAVFCLGVLPCR